MEWNDSYLLCIFLAIAVPVWAVILFKIKK